MDDDGKPLGDRTESRNPLKDSDEDTLFSEYSDDGTPSKHSDDTGPTPTDTDGETETLKNLDGEGCTLRHRKSHLAKTPNASLPGTPTHTTSHPARGNVSTFILYLKLVGILLLEYHVEYENVWDDMICIPYSNRKVGKAIAL